MTERSLIKQDINLSDIVDSKFIKILNDFEYADVSGYAETIGYKIVFFKAKNTLYVDAISLDDICDKNEIELCNLILNKIGFPLNFDSDLSEITKLFGSAYSKSDYIEDCVTYIYLYNKKYFLSFDISNETIIGIEIICNKLIMDNRINCINAVTKLQNS